MGRIKTLKRRKPPVRTCGGSHEKNHYETPNESSQNTQYESADGSSKSSRSSSKSSSKSQSQSPPKLSGPKPPPGPPHKSPNLSHNKSKNRSVLKNSHPASFRGPRGRSHEKRGPKGSVRGAELHEPRTLKVPSTFPDESPPEYPKDTEPEFWKPLFGVHEMFKFRERLHLLMKTDCADVAKKGKWSICQLNKSLISTYFIPKEIETKVDRMLQWNRDSEIDFTRYNILLCAALIVVGVISMKMKDQDYDLLLKGGKAIQLVLSDAKYDSDYVSEDIDLLIRPKKGYEEKEVKFIASQVTYLMKWFLHDDTPGCPFVVSSQIPEKSRMNKFIYKLSYIKDQKGVDYNTGKKDVDMFNPFSDIDFSELPKPTEPFFKYLYEKKFPVPILNQVLLFRCPDISSLLFEKLYYYSKYESFLFAKDITDPAYVGTTPQDCDRYMKKFKPAILALNRALKKEGEDYGYQDPTFPIQSRLINLGFGPNIRGTATHRLLTLLLKVDKEE